ncbi:MAG: 4-(cytidine 5'-diphospho)-2-C-methyl-D-erythritol kinase [Chloroflexi bacterium]|nr:MAG: 4-(cytidine 5'-diphospho)-2-C-methyl-D-erythritol kinase [Chloroflexota bacterium]
MALILPAYAKLNLTLDVTGRRPNGYHDIDSVMQTISLHDLVLVERTDCRVFEVVGAAIEGENLILKAARELEGRVSRQLPFTIRLFKRIPMGAGLGGGSADAAAFLKAANLLYALKLSSGELVEVATAVGQDVPFFLEGGTARATGLGSTVSALPPVPSNWRFLVVDPPIEISTRRVYEAVDGGAPSARRTPALVEALQAPTLTLPQRGREISQGEGKRSATGKGKSSLFGNDLEAVSRRLFPTLDDAINRLREAVPGLTMSGTGAALFAVFANRQDAESALGAVRGLGFPAWLCRPIPAAA